MTMVRAACSRSERAVWLMVKPVESTAADTRARVASEPRCGAEMARLTHNDYLEQFSDSGLPGGLAYIAWIFLALAIAGNKIWRSNDAFAFGIFAGIIGWFLRGSGEFSLYSPALAWTAFTLLACWIGQKINQFDK